MRLFRRWDRRATQLTPHRRPRSTLNLGQGDRGSTYRLIPSKEIGALLRIRKPHATLVGTCCFASRDNDSGCSRIVTGTRGRDGSEAGVSRAAEARGRHGHGCDGFGVNHSSEEATERSRRRAITAVMTVDRACEGRTSVWDGLRKSVHLGGVRG